MSFVASVQQVAQVPSVQLPATGASLLTLILGFLDTIHGPMATLGVCLGAAWVALQMYLAVEKRWFRKDK